MRVLQLWRYPVKSLGGERLKSVDVGSAGLVGDRTWGIYHPETDTVLTARRAPELLFASARLAETAPDSTSHVIITLPDGSEVASSDEGVDTALSSWLGREVSLKRPGTTSARYENPMDVENEADWVSWQGPDWSFHDSKASQISIVGTAALGEFDVRRFRTNVVVDGEGEDRLVGSSAMLGTARLEVMKQIDRCVMVTRPQPGLERDLGVLKQIIAERNNTLSVGALVAEPGLVAVGDSFGA